MADDVLGRIEEQVKNNRVMVFMKGTPNFPQCGFSAHTVDILRAHNTEFESFDVLSDPQVREGVKQYSKWPTIPQIYVDGQFLGGCDIVHELHERGELAALLNPAAKE